MNVRDLMTKSVATCLTTDTLSLATRRMIQHDCGILPVLGLEDRLVGVVTDRDVCRAALRLDQRLSQIHVSDAMTRGAVTIEPGDKIIEAERRMQAARVRRLVVTDGENGDGRVVGILSLDDLALGASTSNVATDIEEHGIIETLASVSRRYADGGKRSQPV
jgi:CBS domain-containing protein